MHLLMGQLQTQNLLVKSNYFEEREYQWIISNFLKIYESEDENHPHASNQQ